MKRKKQPKIDWQEFVRAAAVDGVKKAIELFILTIIAGIALKYVFVAVPAVIAASFFAKYLKIFIN
jgi:hypothetical protein